MFYLDIHQELIFKILKPLTSYYKIIRIKGL